MTAGKGPARGYSWPPFKEGNSAAVKHGAYAVLQLRPRADEIAMHLREAMADGFEPKFEAAVEAAALAAARVEAAMGALLGDADTETLSRLDADARGWLRLFLMMLERLGLTPQVGVEAHVGPVISVHIEPDAERTARVLGTLRDVGLLTHMPATAELPEKAGEES